MIDLRTGVRIEPSNRPIQRKNAVLTAGSCFADAIGERLKKFKFDTSVNPFGVIYNPVSIHRALQYACTNQLPAAHTYLKLEEISVNYDFHSSHAALDAADLAHRLANTIGFVHYFLSRTSHVMLTYGTAWVYHRKDTGDIVANCHKQPASAFERRLLSQAEVVESFHDLHRALKQLNPDVRVILTVSPVRHVRDTLELNHVSKSVLRVACHEIVQQLADVEYFPGFEIMVDDLRDYRFYKSDLIHPTEVAEDYIWEKFSARYFDAATRDFITQWSDVLQALAHRPFHPASPGHQKFLKTLLRRLQDFRDQADVSREIDIVQQQLTHE